MRVEGYGRTECGPVRDNNEDSLLVDADTRIFIVADGMGGHAAGEVASDMAVRTIHAVLTREADPEETRLVDPSTEAPSALMRERLRYAMNQASVAIRLTTEERPELKGMGTTAVVLVVDGSEAHLAHVGDSRAYLLRRGQITRLTRDHTVVQQEIDAGRLTVELARLLPHRNILTQSVGFHGLVEPDTSTHTLQVGDVFLLCSDGVTDVLSDEQLGAVLRGVPAEALADKVVDTALQLGTQDNVTAVVVVALAL